MSGIQCLHKHIQISRFGISLLALLAIAFVLPAHGMRWQSFDYGSPIKCMVSSDSHIWVGGEAVRSSVDDGWFFRVEKKINSRGESLELAGHIVRDISIDPRGRVWFACWDRESDGLTGKGLSMMDPVGFISFSEKTGIPSNEIYSLCSDPQGRLWAGTKEGIAICDEGRWSVHTTEDGLYRNDAVELTVDPHGRIWCGFWRGINAYYDGQWWSWERERVDYVYSIIHGDGNRMYAATKGGLAIYDGERWTFALNRGDLRKRLISSMAMDKDGRIWCAWGGLDKGVSVFDGEKWSRITRRSSQNGLAGNRAIALASDRDGRIWIGDRDGRISVMIPDGVSEIQVKPLPRPDQTKRGLSIGIQNVKRTPASSINRIVENPGGMEWSASETVENEPSPSLIALADVKVNLKITQPADLEAATPEQPFKTDLNVLDIVGGIAAVGDAQLAKLEVNGFAAELQDAVDYGFGGPPIYPFTAKVLLKDISQIHFEIFDKNDRSLGFRDYPINILSPEKEANEPDIHFFKPSVSPEALIATRGGGPPIEVKMTSMNKGIIRGLVLDDTEIKSVFLNEKTVEYLVEASPVHLEEAGIEDEDHIKFFEHRFNLQPGSNRIVVGVFDIFDNSTAISFDIFVQQAISDRLFYEQNYAMVVGIDTYQTWRPLANAVRDAQGIKKVLTGHFGFPEENIFELYNEEATLEGMIGAFEKAAQADRNSRVIIFFAGHGQTTSDRSGGKQGYLIPYDGALSDTNQPGTEVTETWISMQDLTRQIERFDAKHIMLILDACYSGLLTAKRSAVFGEFGYDWIAGGFGSEDAALAEFIRLGSNKAIEVITAGSEDETVLDGGPGGHSFFSGTLIQGLTTGQADLVMDGIITSQELGAYLAHEVQIATQGKQHPAYSKLPGHEAERGLVLFSVSGVSDSKTSMLEPRFDGIHRAILPFSMIAHHLATDDWFSTSSAFSSTGF